MKRSNEDREELFSVGRPGHIKEKSGELGKKNDPVKATRDKNEGIELTMGGEGAIRRENLSIGTRKGGYRLKGKRKRRGVNDR